MSCKTAVLLIFFNRVEELKETFAAVKAAKPKKLYLAQDGPRSGHPSDYERVMACREVVSNIDWDCQVYRRYSETNQGCGRGPYNAINWVFENEDSAIILEDDCIASPSFFTFCDEMLERYWDDKRIFLITGCNFELESSDVPHSYFFGYSGTNWGWATWKRNWISMDYECSWTRDEYTGRSFSDFLHCMTSKEKARQEIKSMYKTNQYLTDGVNISYWDIQWQASRYLQHQLSIIPAKNLITNIGLGVMSTHAQNMNAPKEYYSKPGEIHFCYNKRYLMEFPLMHPSFVMQNVKYDKKIDSKLYPKLYVRVLGRIKREIERVFKKGKNHL